MAAEEAGGVFACREVDPDATTIGASEKRVVTADGDPVGIGWVYADVERSKRTFVGVWTAGAAVGDDRPRVAAVVASVNGGLAGCHV